MRNSVRLIVLATIFAALTGCVTADALKAESAGQTGCVPSAIDVSKPQAVTGGLMWTATCAGKQYLCTDLSAGQKSGQVSCAPAVK